MYMIRLLSSVFVVTCFLIHTHCADNYTDQNRPYEFGFKIDGQQHRHEKKDKNGIIMGEFGFITADDVYHVTVYATDEQGRFKILSMKNIHLKNTKSVTSVRQGHSLQIPSTHQASAVQVTTTTNQPIRKITQESEPISLEPPVNSCSHCSIPTTSTTAPKPLLSINQANSYNTLENRIGSKVALKTRSQVSSVEFNSLSPNAAIQQNSFPSLQSAIKLNQPNYTKGLGLQANSPSIANEREGFPQSLEPAQNYPTQTINRQNQNHPSVNSPSVFGTQQYNTPQEINEGQSYVQAPESKQRFSTVGAPGEQEAQKNTLPQTNAGQLNYRPAFGDQRYLSQEQNYATISRIQQISTPQEINGGQNYVKAPNGQNFVQKTQQNDFAEKTYSRLNYPQGVGTQQNYQPSSASYQPSNPKKSLYVLQPTIEQINSFKSPQSSPQAAVTSNVRSFGTNGQSNELSKNKNIDSQTIKQFVGQTPGEFSPGGNIPEIRTPKQLNGGEAVPGLKSQKPTLAYAQMQIVDKNTDIHTKAPGEKEGLPQGLTKDDMVRLLYTFNYTLGFQGHFEEGYSNGVKQGYYFVTGRNGVRTRIDYTADDKGFHPKISQDVLDLLSDDVPKPETEKQAKYGLKGYEFKWLYYPQD